MLFLARAFAQLDIDTQLTDYFLFTPAQSASLAAARTGFSTYLNEKQIRLRDIQRAVVDARNIPSPDPADIGRLYVEYEVILRGILMRAAAWNASTAALLTNEQLAKLNALKRSTSSYPLIVEAQYTDLIGPTDSGTQGSTAQGNSFGTYITPYLSSLVQGYLDLSGEQASAMQNILIRAYRDSATLDYQISLASLRAEQELLKEIIDPLTVGLIVTQMDAAYAVDPSSRAKLRKDLLALLDPPQLQALRTLEDIAKVLPLTSAASCTGLLPLDFRTLTLAPRGAVAFNVNQLPDLYIGCYLY